MLAIAWPLASNLIERPNDQHGPAIPDIHYGLLASGNQLMRDDALCEKYCTELGILCFEMEAAGLMDSFLCLVIRGISNYSDPHKNDRWKVSAAAAAACANELLVTMPTYDVDRTPTAGNIVAETVNNAGHFILHVFWSSSSTIHIVSGQSVLPNKDLRGCLFRDFFDRGEEKLVNYHEDVDLVDGSLKEPRHYTHA
jgi:hypothetical protein